MSVNNTECPICMDALDPTKNTVVTECGHSFHCSCLMQNAVHNGFGCPYCRTKMADEPEIEDDDDDELSYSTETTVFEENALTSFRMFHQQISGEEVEEEPDDDWVSEDEDDTEEQHSVLPPLDLVIQKLQSRGVTYENLVKSILYTDHFTWDDPTFDYELSYQEIYGQFRAALSQCARMSQQPQAIVHNSPLVHNSHHNPNISQIVPEIAEPKTPDVSRLRARIITHV